MKKIIITAKKGFFKVLNSNFVEAGLHRRINYIISVAEPDHETTITFTPEKGFEEISIEDLKTITDFFSLNR